MALITRIGANNANSFVSLDQAEIILASLYNDADLSEWSALSNSEKEYRLILAAKIIGLMPLRGRRVYRRQALPFPRTRMVPNVGVRESFHRWLRGYDRNAVIYREKDDVWLPEEVCRRIPDEIKEVQCQIALKVVQPVLTSGEGKLAEREGVLGSVSIAGALSVGLNYSVGGKDSGASQGNIFDKIARATQPFIFVKMQKWLSQFRGGSIRSVVDEDFWETCTTLPTTTTTTSTSTSSSTASTTSTVMTESTQSTESTTTTAT